jgi:hypothetical protein
VTAAWFWATHEDEERWNGPEDSREAAIGEAEAEADEEASIWIATGTLVTIETIASHADSDRFLEDLTENVCDDGLLGEDGELEWAHGREQARAALRQFVREHVKASQQWHTIDGKKERVR